MLGSKMLNKEMGTVNHGKQRRVLREWVTVAGEQIIFLRGSGPGIRCESFYHLVQRWWVAAAAKMVPVVLAKV